MTRILVVDDEPTILDSVGFTLEREGFEVLSARDGSEALQLARERVPDVIVLDVMLPGLSGREVCRQLRAESDVPILMLSARAGEVDRVLGLELGADDYVTKPFSPRELNARIQAVLRRSSAPGSVRKFGNVAVDFTRGEVTREGSRIELTALEFKLLRAFLEHAGAVLSLDRLIEIVWGKDVFLTDRVVYTHVNNLRGKIEENPSQPRHIVSLRGLGYRFDV